MHCAHLQALITFLALPQLFPMPVEVLPADSTQTDVASKKIKWTEEFLGLLVYKFRGTLSFLEISECQST